MDTVTYPDTDVRSELEHWVFRRVDVSQHRELAGLFSITAVPIAVALTGDGRTLERLPNFIEPGAFERTLRGLRDADR
ncbi:MAG: thioredoxin-related protein [Chlamydiales bacterium]|jgi:thioredoxin-related protein